MPRRRFLLSSRLFPELFCLFFVGVGVCVAKTEVNQRFNAPHPNSRIFRIEHIKLNAAPTDRRRIVWPTDPLICLCHPRDRQQFKRSTNVVDKVVGAVDLKEMASCLVDPVRRACDVI